MSKEDGQADLLIKNIEDQSIDGDETSFRTYWYRWYINILFSLHAFLQIAIACTWGPISVSAKAALDFTDLDIELFVTLPTTVFIICMPFFAYLMNKKGLRITVLVSTSCSLFATILRCMPVEGSTYRILAHVAQCFNGVASCVVLSAPPFLSNVWFPPKERIMATACLVLIGNFGTVYSALVEPLIVTSVHNPEPIPGNHTMLKTIRKEIDEVMYIYCGCAATVFAAVVLYFPSKPPCPPSATASTDRLSLKESIKHLFTVRPFWASNFAQACIIGAFYSWNGIFADFYSKFNVSQLTSGYISATMNAVGILAGLLVSWFLDRVKGKMKLTISLLLLTTFLAYTYLVVSSMGWIHWGPFRFSDITLWTCCIIIGIAVNAFQPLIMEMAVDQAYPVSEATSSSVMMGLAMFFMVSYCTIMSIVKNQITGNYMLIVFSGLALPVFVFFVPQRNIRLEIDLNESEP